MTDPEHPSSDDTEADDPTLIRPGNTAREAPEPEAPPEGTATRRNEGAPGPGARRRDARPALPGIVLTGELGRGGMGVVYRGRQEYLDREVAVKLLSREGRGPESVQRFQREAKLLAALSHPHIVSCFQADSTAEGDGYLVMEFIEGPDLAKWIRENGRLPAADVRSLGRSIAEALEYAQRSGIIHRDVKPSNVLLKPKHDVAPEDPFPFQPMLADLGIARVVESFPSDAGSAQGITLQGAVIGSPPTMAPEQFDAPDDVDYRADIYGLGCVLFQCMTGRPPFREPSMSKLVLSKAKGAPDPREQHADLPADLVRLVRQMLEPERSQRPQSYAQIVSALEGRQAPPGRGDARARRVVPIAAAVIGLFAIGWFATRPTDPEDDAMHEDVVQQATEPSSITGTPAPPTREPSGGESAAGETSAAPEPAAADVEPPSDQVADANPGTDGELEPLEDAGASPPATDPGDAADTPQDESTALAIGPAPLAPGEVRWLVDAPTIGSLPLQSWTPILGESDVWSQGEESRRSAEALTLERSQLRYDDVPGGSWILRGALAIPRAQATVTERLALVVGFPESVGVSVWLASERAGDAAKRNEVVVRVDRVAAVDGVWSWPEDAPPLRAPQRLDGAAFNSSKPLELTLTWIPPDRLTVQWHLARGDALTDSFTIATEDLAVTAAPTSLALDLTRGAAKIEDLELASPE